MANLLRTKLGLSSSFQALAKVWRPFAIRSKGKLIEFLTSNAQKSFQLSNTILKISESKQFYNLEMSPPKIDLKNIDPKKLLESGEIAQLIKDVNLLKECLNNGCFQYFTVKQALLFICVAIEVGMWFFLGETIGKMHIVGYKV